MKEYRYDLATASDLRYYALPDLANRLAVLEAKNAAEDETGEGGNSNVVTPEKIVEIVGRWTSIPVTRLMSSEKDKLLRLEKFLTKSVVGQPEAVRAVANAIRLSRSGLSNAQRPIASFLMTGPSGTGKTLLSKTVAFLSPSLLFYGTLSIPAARHTPIRLAKRHAPYRRF